MSILRTAALLMGVLLMSSTAMAGGLMQYNTLLKKGQVKERLPGGGRDFLIKVGAGRPGVQLKQFNYETHRWQTYLPRVRASRSGNLIVHMDSGRYKDLQSGKKIFVQPLAAYGKKAL